MLLSYQPYALEFLHPFGVHGDTRLRTPSIMLRLESEGIIGYGEACLPPYLGQTVEKTLEFLRKATELLNKIPDSLQISEIRNLLSPFAHSTYAGLASVDIALNDLYAKKAGLCYREWKGFDTDISRETAHTIGIGDFKQLPGKIEEAREFPILKIKLGTDRDKEIIRFIREHTAKPIFVDVNQGWKDPVKALAMIEWLSTQNVVLVEQPLPVAMKKEMAWLTRRSPLPTIADESVQRFSDLARLDGSFSGVNIKLMKSTGLDETVRMIAYANEHHLKVMLGCMAESSCGTTAMAQLAQFAHYLDLDAPRLYLNDPFTGLSYKNGKIVLNHLPGLGVEPKPVLFGMP
ncbi:MAG TPA: dipeptide epimerase [Bacteroidia bacterium]|nr:dipeptide epimerase [Bacteroidia bacterium]